MLKAPQSLNANMAENARKISNFYFEKLLVTFKSINQQMNKVSNSIKT
jgi:hypothetical protein